MEVVRVLVIEGEVQDADGVDRLQPVVPVSAFGLFPDGEGGVEHAAVLEELLFRLLHFHQEFLSVLVFAIDVEHGFPVRLLRAQLLGVQVGQVGDDL